MGWFGLFWFDLVFLFSSFLSNRERITIVFILVAFEESWGRGGMESRVIVQFSGIQFICKSDDFNENTIWNTATRIAGHSDEWTWCLIFLQ